MDKMSEEETEETIEEEQEEEELSFEELKPRLYRMVYNQPTILLSILEVLFELLQGRGVMNTDEAELVIREGVRRWGESGYA